MINEVVVGQAAVNIFHSNLKFLWIVLAWVSIIFNLIVPIMYVISPRTRKHPGEYAPYND